MECGGIIQRHEPKDTFEKAQHQAWGHAMVSGHGGVVVVSEGDPRLNKYRSE